MPRAAWLALCSSSIAAEMTRPNEMPVMPCSTISDMTNTKEPSLGICREREHKLYSGLLVIHLLYSVLEVLGETLVLNLDPMSSSGGAKRTNEFIKKFLFPRKGFCNYCRLQDTPMWYIKGNSTNCGHPSMFTSVMEYHCIWGKRCRLLWLCSVWDKLPEVPSFEPVCWGWRLKDPKEWEIMSLTDFCNLLLVHVWG